MPTDLTDTEVLAELSEDERFWFPSDGSWAIPHGNCMLREHDWLRRLALARRQLREEREACAAICDAEEAEQAKEPTWTDEQELRRITRLALAGDLAARIRARGGTGNG